MHRAEVKQRIKGVVIHSLLLAREFLETKPKLKSATGKILGKLPYLGRRLQRFGKKSNYRHEVKNEKQLSLSSRAVYRELIETMKKRRAR